MLELSTRLSPSQNAVVPFTEIEGAAGVGLIVIVTGSEGKEVHPFTVTVTV